MAIIPCPECGEPVSDGSPYCPACRHPILEMRPARRERPPLGGLRNLPPRYRWAMGLSLALGFIWIQSLQWVFSILSLVGFAYAAWGLVTHCFQFTAEPTHDPEEEDWDEPEPLP